MQSGQPAASEIDLRGLSDVLSLLVLAAGAGLLVLWLAGDDSIRTVLSFTMKANTALCLALLAGSLLLGNHGFKAVARALSLAALLIGVLTLLEYAGPDLGLDQLLAREARAGEGVHPGRMAPNTAQGIATLGLALTLFPRAGRSRKVAAWLGLLVLVETALALLGYLHGTRSLYQVARALRISQYTAGGLLLLTVAAFAAWPQGTAMQVLARRTPGGLLARRILPPLLAVPVVLGLLRNAGERAGLYDDALGTALMTSGLLLLVGVLVWSNARSIDRLDEAQRRIAAENERLAAEARAAVAARDEFILVAGHELRTPLTALQLRAQLEERRSGSVRVEEARRWTRLIERLSRLVETMLDSSKLAQRRMELEPAEIDLHALVGSTVERLSPIFEAAQTTVQVRSEPGIRVHADLLRLEQAIENVLLNAAKYGAGHDVDVFLAKEQGFALLSVRDRGIGIPAADQERIFERFERAAPISSFGGLGLGLYLARQVMEAHGGSISVESIPGHGATFHLRLPLLGERRSEVSADFPAG